MWTFGCFISYFTLALSTQNRHNLGVKGGAKHQLLHGWRMYYCHPGFPRLWGLVKTLRFVEPDIKHMWKREKKTSPKLCATFCLRGINRYVQKDALNNVMYFYSARRKEAIGRGIPATFALKPRVLKFEGPCSGPASIDSFFGVLAG